MLIISFILLCRIFGGLMTDWLTAASFAAYPAHGRDLAVAHIAALRRIPVALLPVFLVDLKAYDWKFPVEQREIKKRIEFAGANPSSLSGFSGIQVTPALDNPDRVKDPQTPGSGLNLTFCIEK
jgi:hypothetical protein